MKKILLLLILCTPMLLLAQKNKSKFVNYGFDRMPLKPLQGDFGTYSVNFHTRYFNLEEYGLTQDEVADRYVNFEKYERKEMAGDFEVTVKIGSSRISKEYFSESKSSGKGDKKRTWTEHSYIISYSVPVSYKIRDGKRDLMEEGIITTSKFKTNKFGKTKSYTALKKLWINEGGSTYFNTIKGELTSNLQKLQNTLSQNFDRKYIKRSTSFYTIKKAEKKGLQNFEDAFQTVKTMCESSVTTKISKEDMKSTMADAVKTWQEGLANFNPTDKKTRQVFEASGTNLARYYLLLHDIEAAKTVVKTLKKNPKAKSEVASIEKEIKFQEKIAKANVDIPMVFVDKYVEGSDNGSAAEAEEEDQLKSYIVSTNKDTLTGKITYKRSSLGSVEKVYIETKEGKSNFEPVEVEYMMINNKMYKPMPVAKNMGLSTVVEIAEITEWYETIFLYTAEINKEGDEGVFIFKNVKTEKPFINLTSPKAALNYYKFLAKKFDDCPPVQAKLEAKGYDKSEEGLREMVKDYDAYMSKK